MTLQEVILAHRGKPFEWGAVDCLTFSNAATEAHSGSAWCEDWLGAYFDPRSALVSYAKHLRAAGKGNIIEGVDERLDRVDTLHPRDGMICARPADSVLGWSFGIVCEGLEWYMSEDGLESIMPDGGAMYWAAP